MRRVGVQDLLVGLDGLGQVDQRELVDLREPEGQRDDGAVGGRDADLAPDDVGQLLPALRVAVEPVERDQGLLVVGLGLDDGPVGRDGVVDLARLLLVDARQAQHHVDLAARVLEARQLGAEERRELGPVARVGREALQVLEHVGVRRVDVQRAP